MQHLLTDQQKAKHTEFKNFVALNVEPFAEQWDREQRIPDSVISLLAKSGYLGCSLPPDYGGQGWDMVTFGLLNEALGQRIVGPDGCADGPGHGFHGAAEVGHGGAKTQMASSPGQGRNDRRPLP